MNGAGGDPPVVDVSEVSVVLSGHQILHQVDLRVERGEWVSVIGPNGSGKSTLLRTLSGQLPHQGRITLFGTPLGQLDRRTRARRVAMVTQHPVIPAGIGVLDYVLLGRVPYLGALGRESARDLDLVWQVLDRLEVADFAPRGLETLSGGERQRVVLARAIAQFPELLLLDEPTSALDIGHQQQVLDLLDRLRREDGLSVLVTMHDLLAAGEYSDRLVLLSGGRVVRSGPPTRVLNAELISEHYGVAVQVVAGSHGPLVIPIRRSGPPRKPIAHNNPAG